MICDIGGKVGVEPVGPAQHVVLEVQLLDVRFLLAGLAEVLPEDVGGLEPQRAVLFVGPALLRQKIHRLGHISALVEGGLIEPVVIVDLVAGQVALHLGQVHGKAELGQLLLALRGGDVQKLLTMLIVVGLGQVPDVAALIAVLREGHRVLALDDLEIAGLNGVGKLIDLVTGVVDIELPGHVGAAGSEDAGQGVAQHAAPGIAHVHGARGVGGDELHHDLLALEGVSGAVVGPFGLHSVHDTGIPAVIEAEIQKAGARDLGGSKVAALQIHMAQQGLGDIPGCLAQLLGGRQGKGGGKVAVGGVLGDLHRGGLDLRLGQRAVRHRRLVGGHGQGRRLVFRVLYHVDHRIESSLLCIGNRLIRLQGRFFFPFSVSALPGS